MKKFLFLFVVMMFALPVSYAQTAIEQTCSVTLYRYSNGDLTMTVVASQPVRKIFISHTPAEVLDWRTYEGSEELNLGQLLSSFEYEKAAGLITHKAYGHLRLMGINLDYSDFMSTAAQAYNPSAQYVYVDDGMIFASPVAWSWSGPEEWRVTGGKNSIYQNTYFIETESAVQNPTLTLVRVGDTAYPNLSDFIVSIYLQGSLSSIPCDISW